MCVVCVSVVCVCVWCVCVMCVCGVCVWCMCGGVCVWCVCVVYVWCVCGVGDSLSNNYEIHVLIKPFVTNQGSSNQVTTKYNLSRGVISRSRDQNHIFY